MVSEYATSAKELALSRPIRFRARKAARRSALAALGLVPARHHPGVRIVHYHYVFGDEEAQFLRQVEYILREFEPVSLSAAVERLSNGIAGGRELAVTFDDGFKNQLRAAAKLTELGITACFFLITELLSAGSAEAALICRDRLHLPQPVEPLDWDDAGELLALGHEIGSHTRSHRNLLDLEQAALDEELHASKEELERRLGRQILHLSVPYGGRDRFGATISGAAREAGYASCSTAIRGRNVSGADVFALRRDHLEAHSPVSDVRYFLHRP
jgi:peptidoglycan/xylan/chitin deacetylase (PgdA/CDA1 family)